ncbi:MAG: ISAs1 family transposase [Candidatus Dojkabacteria bacterium]
MESKTLFDIIEQIADPRKKRGVRHPFHAILKLVILGYICRLVWIEHVAVYAKNHWDKIKVVLGFTRDYAPDATTIRRALQGLDRRKLEEAFEEWICEQLGDKEFTVAADGKALCGVAGHDDEPAQLINIFIHDLKIAIAQFPTEKKKGEPTVLRDALKSLFDRYPGLRILTGDAAFAGRDMCQAIIELGRDYLIQIKGNQPKIKEVLELHFDEESQKRKPDAGTVEKKRSGDSTRHLGLRRSWS